MSRMTYYMSKSCTYGRHVPMCDVDEPKVNPRDFLALTTLSIECTCYNDKSVR